jgi:hypothetical protein
MALDMWPFSKCRQIGKSYLQHNASRTTMGNIFASVIIDKIGFNHSIANLCLYYNDNNEHYMVIAVVVDNICYYSTFDQLCF